MSSFVNTCNALVNKDLVQIGRFAHHLSGTKCTGVVPGAACGKAALRKAASRKAASRKAPLAFARGEGRAFGADSVSSTRGLSG
jgi:hypothetical protein